MIKILTNCKKELPFYLKNRKVYCFGAGQQFGTFLKEWNNPEVVAVVDNDREKQRNGIDTGERHYRVLSLEQFRSVCEAGTFLVITTMRFDEIIRQLDEIEELDGVECCVYFLIKNEVECSVFEHTYMITEEKIPRKIHYCWFGGNKMPEEFKENISSWRKYCPNYEIIRWDETNYDVGKSSYMKQAYECKKWAFVTDYARLDIVQTYGGIYFDTDVEVVKSFDELLGWEFFCGFENDKYVASGLGFGSIANHWLLAKLLDKYDRMNFLNEDGSLNEVACPVVQSEIMEKAGFQMNGKFQAVNGVAVYPRDFFNSGGYYEGAGELTENSYSIHKYSGSWNHSESYQKNRRMIKQKIQFVRQRIEQQEERNR